MCKECLFWLLSYRSAEEIAEAKKRDPIERAKKYALEGKLATEDELKVSFSLFQQFLVMTNTCCRKLPRRLNNTLRQRRSWHLKMECFHLASSTHISTPTREIWLLEGVTSIPAIRLFNLIFMYLFIELCDIFCVVVQI